MKLTVDQEKQVWNELSCIFAWLDNSHFGKLANSRLIYPPPKSTKKCVPGQGYFVTAWRALWTRSHQYLAEVINVAETLIDDARIDLNVDLNHQDIQYALAEIYRLEEKYLALEKDLNFDLIQHELKEIKNNQVMLFKKMEEISSKLEIMNTNLEKKANRTDIPDLISLRVEMRSMAAALMTIAGQGIEKDDSVPTVSEPRREKRSIHFLSINK